MKNPPERARDVNADGQGLDDEDAHDRVLRDKVGEEVQLWPNSNLDTTQAHSRQLYRNPMRLIRIAQLMRAIRRSPRRKVPMDAREGWRTIWAWHSV